MPGEELFLRNLTKLNEILNSHDQLTHNWFAWGTILWKNNFLSEDMNRLSAVPFTPK